MFTADLAFASAFEQVCELIADGLARLSRVCNPVLEFFEL